MPSSKPRFPEDLPSDQTVFCPDIEESLSHYIADLGYRLIKIFPADRPRIAVVEKDGRRVQLESDHLEEEPEFAPEKGHFVVSRADDSAVWHEGRAGMQYRDLIPGRLGGRVIASHIRIPEGGPVPDYVHFHKIDFQIICCIRGWCELVYEDQGPSFRFEAGDCVLQPPGIRHRVLKCSDGFEVIELSSPAEHPTYAEHGFELPTNTVARERSFAGQTFLHFKWSESVSEALTDGVEITRTGVTDASGGAIGLEQISITGPMSGPFRPPGKGASLIFILNGSPAVKLGHHELLLNKSECLLNKASHLEIEFATPGTEFLLFHIR